MQMKGFSVHDGLSGDIYSYPGTDVLINKLDIRDRELQETVSAKLSMSASRAIRELPVLRISGWNPETYRELHRTLFRKMYSWAGEYRTSDVATLYDHTAYEPPGNIERKVQEVFDYISRNNGFRDESYGEKMRDLSLVFGQLKNLQPFRDGNTRTAMLFTDMLARSCGVYLDYQALGSTEADRERFAKAQIASRDGNPTPLMMEFASIAYPANEKDQIDREHLRGMAMPKIIEDGKKHSFTKQIRNHQERKMAQQEKAGRD